MYIWWRVLTSFWTVLEIEFLPVYVPSTAEQEDANLFAENVRRFMAAKSGREISEFGFEDCRLVQAVQSLNLPMEISTLNVVNTSKTLHITTEAILHELKHFALEATKHESGRINLTSFGDLIHVPIETQGSICAEAFMTFEKGQTGLMEFKEYLTFISLAKKIGDESNLAKIAEIVGENGEPYNYEELEMVTKVVAWRRHLDPSKIDSAAAKLRAEVKAHKERHRGGMKLVDALANERTVNQILNV